VGAIITENELLEGLPKQKTVRQPIKRIRITGKLKPKVSKEYLQVSKDSLKRISEKYKLSEWDKVI